MLPRVLFSGGWRAGLPRHPSKDYLAQPLARAANSLYLGALRSRSIAALGGSAIFGGTLIKEHIQSISPLPLL